MKPFDGNELEAAQKVPFDRMTDDVLSDWLEGEGLDSVHQSIEARGFQVQVTGQDLAAKVQQANADARAARASGIQQKYDTIKQATDQLDAELGLTTDVIIWEYFSA